MGGGIYETMQPERFLFGDTQDLNYLAAYPTKFNYPLSKENEATRALRALVNIRKDSLKLISHNSSQHGRPSDNSIRHFGSGRHSTRDPLGPSQGASQPHPPGSAQGSANHPKFHIEFTLDADCQCTITVYFFAREEIINGCLKYVPRNEDQTIKNYTGNIGTNQRITIPTPFDPLQLTQDINEWHTTLENGIYPIVIQIDVKERDYFGHSHAAIATLEPNPSDPQLYSIKLLKQKQFIEGCLFILQEIYGIENKVPKSSSNPSNVPSANRGGNSARADTVSLGDLDGDTGMECVVCMSEARDTLIVPCRHLCLCSACADGLKNQASNCPICRSPFRALLRIRALRKKLEPDSALFRTQISQTSQAETNVPGSTSGALSEQGAANSAGDSSDLIIPVGYEAVSLVEALNGVSVVTGVGADGRRSVRTIRSTRSPHTYRAPLGTLHSVPSAHGDRCPSALTTTSGATDTYQSIGPGASILAGMHMQGAGVSNQRTGMGAFGGRESVNTARTGKTLDTCAATGARSAASEVSSYTPAGHRSELGTVDFQDYDDEDRAESTADGCKFLSAGVSDTGESEAARDTDIAPLDALSVAGTNSEVIQISANMQNHYHHQQQQQYHSQIPNPNLPHAQRMPAHQGSFADQSGRETVIRADPKQSSMPPSQIKARMHANAHAQAPSSGFVSMSQYTNSTGILKPGSVPKHSSNLVGRREEHISTGAHPLFAAANSARNNLQPTKKSLEEESVHDLEDEANVEQAYANRPSGVLGPSGAEANRRAMRMDSNFSNTANESVATASASGDSEELHTNPDTDYQGPPLDQSSEYSGPSSAQGIPMHQAHAQATTHMPYAYPGVDPAAAATMGAGGIPLAPIMGINNMISGNQITILQTLIPNSNMPMGAVIQLTQITQQITQQQQLFMPPMVVPVVPVVPNPHANFHPHAAAHGASAAASAGVHVTPQGAGMPNSPPNAGMPSAKDAAYFAHATRAGDSSPRAPPE